MKEERKALADYPETDHTPSTTRAALLRREYLSRRTCGDCMSPWTINMTRPYGCSSRNKGARVRVEPSITPMSSCTLALYALHADRTTCPYILFPTKLRARNNSTDRWLHLLSPAYSTHQHPRSCGINSTGHGLHSTRRRADQGQHLILATHRCSGSRQNFRQ